MASPLIRWVVPEQDCTVTFVETRRYAHPLWWSSEAMGMIKLDLPRPEVVW